MTDAFSNLSPLAKRQLLTKLLQEKARAEAQVAPLSYGQQALWFVHQWDRQSSAYNILCAARIRADVNRDALRRSFERLVERHEALRTTFGVDRGQPVARVRGWLPCPLELTAAAAWSDAQVEQWIHERADRPFDLETGPLLRAELIDRGALPPILLVTAAHIALDFWSLDLLLEELAAQYRIETTGEPADLRPLGRPCAEFAPWQESLLAGDEGDRLEDYWRKELAGPLPVLHLPTDRPRPPVQTYRGRSHRLDVPDELARRLATLAKNAGASLYAVFLAAYHILLHRYTGQRDILIGSTTAGRNHVQWEATIGYFLNVIVLRGRPAPDMRFDAFLAQVRDTVLNGLEHQDYPFPLLVERLAPPRDLSRSPVFQAAFNWDQPRQRRRREGVAQRGSSDIGDLGLEPYLVAQQGAAFEVTLAMVYADESLSGAFQYNSDLFETATIARMAEHFLTLLESIAADPKQKISALRLLPRRERQLIVEDWNDTVSDYPRDACIHDLLAAQAARTPQQIAARFANRAVTYKELEERSNRLARRLRQMGVGPDVLVGVCVDRSLDLLVSLVGVLKAGGAYLPLAPEAPRDRLGCLLEESQAAVIVTENRWREKLPARSDALVCVDADWPGILQEDPAALPRVSQPHHLAYVIFTSGSTGRPKGVQIEHRSVVNFLTMMQRRPGIEPCDRLLAVTTATFDISVLELFLPLTVGAQVVIADRQVAADGQRLVATLAEAGITVMQATPATWRLLIQAGWAGDSRLKALCGGETLPRDLANWLSQRCGSLWNMYGPTETTIWSAVGRVTPGAGLVPLGRPIANTQIYILDESLQPVPLGVPGELFIGGDGLARGYLHRPDLTAERFVEAPFLRPPGHRLYRTGDRARLRPDGSLEFLGRVDSQVKVRGFRIELGEIEATLAQHPAVRANAVIMRQASSHEEDKQLAAYVVLIGDDLPTASDLREFLKQKLPDYMIPGVFVALDALPLTPAGKVDRQALPAPDAARLAINSDYVAPRDALERTLAEIWAAVLDRDSVGVHDNYFDLGGASLQSLEVSARAAVAGLEVSPTLVFQHPTIAELAKVLRARSIAWRPADDFPSPAPPPPPPSEHHRRSLESARFPVSPDATAAPAVGNTCIESLGVYLPPREVSTQQVLAGCRKRVWFPLEQISGIQTRRMSGEGDYFLDLARKAAEECLANSRYDAADIDLLICSNISRGVDPLVASIEPGAAVQLKKLLRCENAIAFDITNACAGMFTAIHVVDAFLRVGAIRRALVVSGEYLTAVTRTAQLEISGFLDSRIACLTVGDAGAAVLLEMSPGAAVGFHELDLYTVSQYSRMCIGRLTDRPHGGAILHVPDPIRHTSVSIEHSVRHAQHVFQKSGAAPEDVQHLIVHQTSRRSLRDGMRAINKTFGRKISHEANTIDNLTHRGNTGSTSYFVALWDHILNGRIRAGEKIFFAVSGSGQTIGTGICTLDGLPDRLRAHKQNGIAPAKASVEAKRFRPPCIVRPRVGVASIGTHRLSPGLARDTTQLTVAAAEKCLARWGKDRRDIDLVLFCGMTRTGYVGEPATATFIASDLKINDAAQSDDDKKTLAFDVVNGALGVLNGCEVAVRTIQSGRRRAALVVSSEIDVNLDDFPDDPLGLQEAGSALVLERSPDGRSGFGDFVYRYATEHQHARSAMGRYRGGKPYCDLYVDPQIESWCLSLVRPAVDELLEREGLALCDVRMVLPSQFSRSFNSGLAERLGLPLNRIVALADDGADYFTNSLPFSLQWVWERSLAQPGDVGLIVQVASGLQLGCATYYF